MTKTALKGATALAGHAYADDAGEGSHSPEFSDAMTKMMDMVGDACSKMDAVSGRLDGIEERFSKADARMDAMEKGDPKEPAADSEESEEAKAAREDKARKDAAEAEEKAKADAAEAEEKAKADATKKDGEEGDKEEAKADSVARAGLTDVQRQIAEINARMPKALSDDERDQFASIQEQADRAYQAFGDRAGPPLDGETPLQYKRRLVGKLQKHSKAWGATKIGGITDMSAVDVIADQVYADAIAAARRGADLPAGHLRQIKHDDGHGHTIYTYEGDSPLAWMTPFAGHHHKSQGDFIKPN